MTLRIVPTAAVTFEVWRDLWLDYVGGQIAADSTIYNATKQVKEKLLFQLTNAGNPFIYVEEGNYENKGELLLRHDHQGVDLRADYAREVLRSLVRVWKRPVNLLTVLEGKASLLRFDGKEHSSRATKS